MQHARAFAPSRLGARALLAAMACLLVASVQAEELTSRLSGASEVPPTTSTALGTFKGSVNKSSNLLSWTITYSGLSGAPSGGHFHGPAMAGENAGVVLPFMSSLDSPISGTATLTPAQTAELLDGKWYVNLHTAGSPSGEIRGQVVVAPP